MYHILFILGIFSSFILGTCGLKMSFQSQPIAAQDNTFTWTRDSSDPPDFYLQKIKFDGDQGPTAPSGPVAVPNIAAAGGQALMHFNRAGVFQIIAVDTRNPDPKHAFYQMIVTVQVNPTSSGAPQATGTFNASDPQSGGGSSNSNDNNGGSNGNWHGGHGHGGGDNEGNGKNQQMNNNPETSDSNLKPNSQENVPKIVGIVLGVVVFFFLVAAIFLYLRYRRQRRTSNFQRGMMVRSPGSIKPFMISQPMDPEKRDGFSSYAFDPHSQPRITAYGDLLPPTLAYRPDSPSVTDSVGTSVSRRRPNELIDPRSRFSEPTATTLTLESSGSGETDSRDGSFVQFPVPSLPSRIRTSRQMMIEEDIQALQRKILELQGRCDLTGVDAIDRDEQLKEIKERVERLQDVHEGPWALHQTEVIPAGLFN